MKNVENRANFMILKNSDIDTSLSLLLHMHETFFHCHLKGSSIELLGPEMVHNLLTRTQCPFMQNILICFMNCRITFPSKE